MSSMLQIRLLVELEVGSAMMLLIVFLAVFLTFFPIKNGGNVDEYNSAVCSLIIVFIELLILLIGYGRTFKG